MAIATPEGRSLSEILEASGNRWNYSRERDGGRYSLELKMSASYEAAELAEVPEYERDDYRGDPVDCVVLEGEDDKYRIAMGSRGKSTPPVGAGELPHGIKVIFDLNGNVLGAFGAQVRGGEQELEKIDLESDVLKALMDEILTKGISQGDFSVLATHGNEAKALSADQKAEELELKARGLREVAKLLRDERAEISHRLRARIEELGGNFESFLQEQIGPKAKP
ncbi:MAG: hypothetical protein AAB588_03010 [Patescibacteria group bacterium]